MSLKITMGSPEAQELQNSIQAELAKSDYAPDDDPVMAEYITVMLANNKTSEQITEELVDLIGDNYDAAFTTWLFARASGEVPAAVKTEQVTEQNEVEAALLGSDSRSADRAAPPHLKPSQGMFAKAVAASSSNPPTQPGQKRTAAQASEDEPASKRRVSGGGLAGVPTGPRAKDGAEKKNLLDRMGGVKGNEARQNQDAFQSKIDNLTQNVAGVPQQQQLRGQFAAQRQQQQLNQQRGGQFQNGQRQNGGQINNNMGGFGGQMGMGGMDMSAMNMGGINMGVQEMMLAQMAQMQFMQQQMAQMAQAQQQQQQVPFSGGPQRTNGASNRPNHHQQAPRPAGGRATIKAPAALAKPTDTTLCKFSLGCTNAQCPYSHPSPVATPESALVLDINPCELQRKCKDADCTKSHVSPASVAGHAGPSQLPCKYQNCNNSSCPFLHTDAEGNAIPPPALTDPSLAVPHPKKEPKFASAPKPKPYHAPVSKGGFSPYTKGKPTPIAASGGMNKSVKFNPEAAAFVPKPAAHVSDRLVGQTEGGGEKIIPSPSPAPAGEKKDDEAKPASAPVPEVKKEGVEA